jgi:UDP-2,3-diacylglucosamine pyrophosphatase LpxH
MLVFISDLHISDKSAGIQFVPADAFELVFDDIAEQARDAGSKRIEVVFLGDVFDLIRTTYWFEHPPDERPWGMPDDARRHQQTLERHCHVILDRIAEANAEVLTYLRDKALRHLKAEVTWRYLPGNHDRLATVFPTTRQRVRQLLGLDLADPTARFARCYLNPRYRALGRHGHEFDTFNSAFTQPPPLTDDPSLDELYSRVPIGDVIACEIISKLAPAVQLALAKRGHPDAAGVAQQLRQIDDVRPLAAAMPWMVDRLQRMRHDGVGEDYLPALVEALRTVFADFGALPYVRHWQKEHGLSRNALMIRAITFVGEHMSADLMKSLAPLLELGSALSGDDDLTDQAAAELDRLNATPTPDGPYLYVLYGHTHSPTQVPLELTDDGAARVYVNTGTWRGVHQQTRSGQGFASWKAMSYCFIYHAEDDPQSPAGRNGRHPTFETWTGSLEEHDPDASRAVDPATLTYLHATPAGA